MNRTVTLLFLPRDAMHKRGRYAVARCPFVRLSRSWLLWKWINISSKFFNCRVASHAILVFAYKTSRQYSDGGYPTGASNAGGVGKNRDSRRISAYRVDDRVMECIQQLRPSTVQFTAQTATRQPAWTTTTKRREENRIYSYKLRSDSLY